MAIPQLVTDAVGMCDNEVRTSMFTNIVVTGGNSLLQGFVERLEIELQGLVPACRIKLVSPSNPVERKYSCWLGGSILGSLTSFHQMWIGKQEYEEYGKGIVERRCL